jgi:hypothetical protein
MCHAIICFDTLHQSIIAKKTIMTQINSDKPKKDLDEDLRDFIERNNTEKEALLKVLKYIENQKTLKKNKSKKDL